MKNQILEFLEYIGVPVSLLVTALAGSLLAASQEKKDKQLSIPYMLLRLATGFFLSIFLTPVIVKTWNLDINESYGLSFLIGHFGAIILDIIRNLIEGNKEILKEATKTYLSGVIEKWTKK